MSSESERCCRRCYLIVGEMSKKKMMVVERRWDELNPEILSLVFTRMAVDEMVRVVPFVCKPWMEVVAGPYCWSDVDVEEWCRRRNDTHAVDMLVKKLVRRSKFSIQRLSVYRMAESGFFFIAHCGRCLKVLQIPTSGITDEMVSKHLKPLPNLTFLDISHCLDITSKGIAEFGKQCKSLLHLKRNMPPHEEACPTPINDSEAKTIAETMPNLQNLEFCCGQFGDSGLSEILSKCKSLTHLDIRGSWNVDLNADVEKICEKLRQFQDPWIESDNELGATEESDNGSPLVSESD